MRLTLLRAKEALAKKAPADELEFRLNRVVERLILHGKFVGSTQRIGLTAKYGQVALPPQFRTILGVKVDGRVFEIGNHWWDFIPGKCDPAGYCMDEVVDMGDGHATLYPVQAGGTLRVDYAGTAQPVDIYGTDADGAALTLTISNATPVANTFATIERIHKEIIDGGISLVQIDADAAETSLAGMTLNEEETYYRRYSIESRTATLSSVIDTLVKIRHVEFTSDSDILPIGNISALSLGLDGLQMESENDHNQSASYFNDAVALLNAELKDTNGEGSIPAIRFIYPAGTKPRFRSQY